MIKYLIQVGILLVAYYVAPDIIYDFLSDADQDIREYSVLFFKVAVVVLTIVSLLRIRTNLEKSITDFLKTQMKLKQPDAILNKFSNLFVQIIYISLIVTISIPLLKLYLGNSLITLIKIGVLLYCLFLGWGIYKLFDTDESAPKSTES